MRFLFKIASGVRRIYWYLFRPKTTGVKCLIECEDAYLLVKHSYGSRQHNWNLPGGGVVKNEDLIGAVKREVREELGIILTHITKLTSYTSTAEYKRDTIHCFYSKVSNKKLSLNHNEIKEAVWFPKNDLPENLARSTREGLAILKK